MKHDRLSKQNLRSAGAHVGGRNSFVPGQAKVVPCRPADFCDMTSGDAASTCGETNVWRQARQMRQEWRRQRYSRLKMG
jgi:hypothetical protein